MRKWRTENPTKQRPLPPLPLPSIARFSLKDLHPVVPIIIGLALTGFGSNMKLTLSGLFACSVWLCLDLVTYARWVGTWWANRTYFLFRSHFGGYGKKEAEANRKKMQWALTSLAMCLCCLVVLFAFSNLSRWIINQYMNEREINIRGHLDATYSMPSDRVLKNAQFTLTNNSSEDIRLRKIGCHVGTAILANDMRIDDDYTFTELVLTLHASGDHESVSCPADNRFFGRNVGYVECADVEIEAVYSTAAIPNRFETKLFRYALYRGNHDWTPMALDDPQVPCE